MSQFFSVLLALTYLLSGEKLGINSLFEALSIMGIWRNLLDGVSFPDIDFLSLIPSFVQ